MTRKIITFLALSLLAGALWFIDSLFDNYLLQNLSHSLIALTLIYLLFKIILEEINLRHISDSRSRYSFRRIISILNIVAFVIAGIAIWVENTQTILVSYGLVAAGVAVALQDFFKNIMGGIILFLTGVYRIGDRIELDQKHGDVIDIGLQYTTLLEIQEWIAGDQPTGRLVTSPNGKVLSKHIINYTKDHEFIWDELTIPITYDSNWRRAKSIILGLAERETKENTETARESLINLSAKYYLPIRSEVPALYLSITDNWIEMVVRYVTPVRQRRTVKHKLMALILEEFEKAEDVKIASETMDISLRNPSAENLSTP